MQDYYKGQKKCQLLFTDTDSLMMEITTEDFFHCIAEINSNPKYKCFIDVSSFDDVVVLKYKIPRKNDKQIGAFKSETWSEQIAEFMRLRAKMYSFIIDGRQPEKHFKAKRVAWSSLNFLAHQKIFKLFV